MVNVILLASQTSKEGLLQANGLPREYHGQCLSFAGQTLVLLNPNILVRDVERIYFISFISYSFFVFGKSFSITKNYNIEI